MAKKTSEKNVRFVGAVVMQMHGVGILKPGTVYARAELPGDLVHETQDGPVFTNGNFEWTEDPVTPETERSPAAIVESTPSEGGEQ